MVIKTRRKDPELAFKQAIEAGRLSDDYRFKNYAGGYMYMGPGQNGRDAFKNIDTREYDV